MKQIINRILCLFILFSPLSSFADLPILTPLWQSDALFEQPESLVFDNKRQHLYVSNINGDPSQVDGNGYISTLSVDGNIIEQYWLTGLNAPKGLTIVGNNLYIADINELLIVDLTTKKITQRYTAPQAKFLNDVVADPQGNIYVSAFLSNTIYRLSDGKFTVWLSDQALEVPNGLLIEDNHLIVASWGVMTDGFASDIPGHLKRINLDSKKITSLGDGSAVGNLDGIEADGNGHYFVSDWMNGNLLHINKHGIANTLISLEQGSADLTVIPAQQLIIIPMMLSNNIIAFKIN